MFSAFAIAAMGAAKWITFSKILTASGIAMTTIHGINQQTKANKKRK